VIVAVVVGVEQANVRVKSHTAGRWHKSTDGLKLQNCGRFQCPATEPDGRIIMTWLD